MTARPGAVGVPVRRVVAAAVLLFLAQLPWSWLPPWLEATLPAIMILGAASPLLAAVAAGARFRCWVLFSALWWLLSSHWLIHVDPVLGIFAWLIMTVVGTALTLPLGWLLYAIRDRHGPSRMLWFAPLAWAGWEMARCWSPVGTPWLALAHSYWKLPVFFQIAELTGYYSLSLAVAMVSAGLARALLGDRAAGRQLALGAALLALLAAYGAVRLRQLDLERGEPLTSALIQANIPIEEKQYGSPLDLLRRNLRLTTEAPPVDLVVWSETAVPTYLMRIPELRSALEATARGKRATLIVGGIEALGSDPRRLGSKANAAFVIGPDGSLWDTYRKVHLLMFGEYLPGRELPLLRRLARLLPQFTAGRRYRAVDTPLGRLAVAICYESVFPFDIRAMIRDGGRAIVVITNDDQLGQIGARQHYQQAVFRCVETRRWMARCANSGICAVIDPAGRVVGATEWDRATVHVGALRRRDDRTPYLRWGDWFAWTCLLVAVAAAVFPGRAAGGNAALSRSDP